MHAGVRWTNCWKRNPTSCRIGRYNPPPLGTAKGMVERNASFFKTRWPLFWPSAQPNFSALPAPSLPASGWRSGKRFPLWSVPYKKSRVSPKRVHFSTTMQSAAGARRPNNPVDDRKTKQHGILLLSGCILGHGKAQGAACGAALAFSETGVLRTCRKVHALDSENPVLQTSPAAQSQSSLAN